MAEYISREEIEKKAKYRKELGFPYVDIIDIHETPTADVIERSKIDKALEQTYKVREMVLHSNITYEVNDVLDIIDEISAYFESI